MFSNLLVAVAAALATMLVPAPATAQAGTPAPAPPTYRPPLDRPVEHPFDVAAGPFGRGTRGLDYSVQPGDTVVAIGEGTVVFAAAVAGSTWITVDHPDGLRSSYGPMASVAVAVGAVVRAGDPVGTTGRTFHLGVRRGDVYLDPATLFPTRRRHARLVPSSRVRGRRP